MSLLGKAFGSVARTVGRAADVLAPEGSTLDKGAQVWYNAGQKSSSPNWTWDGNGWTQVKGAYTNVSTTNPGQGGGNAGGGGGGGYSSGGGGGGGGGGYAAPKVDPAAVMSAQDLIDQANFTLSQLGGQRSIFNSNLDKTFGNYRAQLDNTFGRNKADYTQNRTNTISEQQQAKAKIDQQVRQRASALQRLLGAAGAGDSQAAYELAPYAAARTGTQMRSEINNSYGKNLQGLDQNWGRYNTDYQNNILSLEDQKAQKRSEQEQAFLNNEASARENLVKGQSAMSYAQGGNANQARAIHDAAMPIIYQILQQITNLGAQQVSPTIKDATYTAPKLDQYTVENAGAVQGIDPAVGQDINPYYQMLLKKGEEDQQNFGY